MSIRYHLGKFPPAGLRWEELIPLLGPASAALARYDGLLQAIPNPHVLLAPLTTQEAVLSSRIEGTQATASEVFEFEADEGRFTAEKRDDIREVLNYRRALSFAVDRMNELPLSLRLLLDSHRLLMSGVRGANKAPPGDYRRIQNWIGSILELYQSMKLRIADLTHSQHAVRALDFIFQTPTFTGPSFERRSEMPVPTARRILRLLRDEGILQTIREPSGRTPGIFSHRALLRRADGDFADHP